MSNFDNLHVRVSWLVGCECEFGFDQNQEIKLGHSLVFRPSLPVVG